jgi:Calcineurin-like phosphoesterase
MKFQYFSDIHTKFYADNPHYLDKLHVHVNAPYLILVGDVGDPFSKLYSSFMSALTGKFDQTFLLAGNHEYYDHIIPKTGAKVREVCWQFPKITLFLQDEVHVIPGSDIMLYDNTL